MSYEITMPVLSDTMDKGILVKWHKKEGDKVKKGEIIAEVESDKAILEIESFYDGYIHLIVNEGDEVEVKKTIAIVDNKQTQKIETNPKKEIKKKIPKQNKLKPIKTQPLTHHLTSGIASPLAKELANKYNIDLSKLPSPTHEKEIKNYLLDRYFTPKAKKLVLDYNIFEEFELNHKINSDEVLKKIKQDNIPKKIKISPNQQHIIKNVENSIQKPTFFIFDEIELKNKNHKLTAIIIKALAISMKQNPKSRTILKDDFLEFQSVNISIAVNRDDGLYMVVLKNCDELSLDEINNFLKEVKTKKLSIQDLKNSTFGISNLGMFGVESFTSLINQQDSGILSVGVNKNGKIKVTFTFDHRIFNGVEAALFVKDFKENIKGIK